MGDACVAAAFSPGLDLCKRRMVASGWHIALAMPFDFGLALFFDVRVDGGGAWPRPSSQLTTNEDFPSVYPNQSV
jgi:hypothetical protein